MLINIELPTGVTIKVESEWYYSMSDIELKNFYENNMLNMNYHQTIIDPFDNSVMLVPSYKPDIDDLEDFDDSIDFIPDDV